MTPTTRSMLLHGGILAFAGVLAFRSWTRTEDTSPNHGEVVLWPGTPDEVQEVRFESKVGTIRLEPREDSHGKYVVGTVNKNPEPSELKKPADASKSSSTPAEPPPQPKTSHFIATKQGEDLIEQLAPLRALRVLGKMTQAQKKDFGMDQEEGKLFVSSAGKEHELVFGGATPGGTDRYASDAATGNAYVVSGSIYRDLTLADERLTEHRMHTFESSSVKRIKITAGGVKRELVRSTDKNDAWTKPDAPAGRDETATNWLSKVNRLSGTSFESEKLEPPPAPADMLFRIDYYDERKPIGFIELVRRPSANPSEKPEYVARTETTRWYTTVIRSAAEQIDQDMKSVVSP